MVSDAMAAAGNGDGTYTIGALPVEVKNGVARLTSNQKLAGSTSDNFPSIYQSNQPLWFVTATSGTCNVDSVQQRFLVLKIEEVLLWVSVLICLAITARRSP
jgi:hypothetical protein